MWRKVKTKHAIWMLKKILSKAKREGNMEFIADIVAHIRQEYPFNRRLNTFADEIADRFGVPRFP
jgi:hypothetical protein